MAQNIRSIFYFLLVAIGVITASPESSRATDGKMGQQSGGDVQISIRIPDRIETTISTQISQNGGIKLSVNGNSDDQQYFSVMRIGNERNQPVGSMKSFNIKKISEVIQRADASESSTHLVGLLIIPQ